MQEQSDGSIGVSVGVKRITIDELQQELESTIKENIKLNWENERLREELERVQKELEKGRGKPMRHVAPFSRGEPKANPKRPGRRKGHKGARCEVLKKSECACFSNGDETSFGLTYDKIKDFFKVVFGLEISRGVYRNRERELHRKRKRLIAI